MPPVRACFSFFMQMEMNRYAVTFGKARHFPHKTALNMNNIFFLCFCSVSQTAGLRLLARHASQFSCCLMDHYRALFEVMSKLCGHINAEMKKTSYYALEAFLKQVNTYRAFPDKRDGN